MPDGFMLSLFVVDVYGSDLIKNTFFERESISFATMDN